MQIQKADPYATDADAYTGAYTEPDTEPYAHTNRDADPHQYAGAYIGAKYTCKSRCNS